MIRARRNFMLGGLMLAAATLAGPAYALTEAQASAHVEATLTELKGLLKVKGDTVARVPKLRKIMETRANLPLIARYSAGTAWRSMSEAQQKRFVDAFAHYISVIYSKRFDDYAGDPKFDIAGVTDAGKKGMLVASPVTMPGQAPVQVDWLVSDRGGRVEIVDLVIEGISMLQTQREELGVMFEKRGGDVDALIATMEEAK